MTINSLNKKEMAGGQSVAVAISGQDGTLQYYNDIAAELWGRSPQTNSPGEMLFSGAWKLYSPEGVPIAHHHSPVARTIRHNISLRDEEICFEKPDGSRAAILQSTDPIRGLHDIPQGAISLFCALPQDKSNAPLRTMDEVYEEAIIENSLDGTITGWNRGASRLFGYSREEAMGHPIDLLTPAPRKREELHLRSQLARDETIEAFETVRMTKDKRQMLVSLRAAAVKDSEGNMTGSSQSLRDITWRVPVRQKLEEYAHHISLQGKQKDEFLGLVSHELRTPVTSLKGYVELIESEANNDRFRLYAGRAKRQVDTLSSLISDMLDLSRIENGKLNLNFTSFDMKDLVEECLDHRRSQHPDFVFENLAAEKPPMMVIGDRERLEQVLYHLVHNAVEYSQSNKKIVVDAKVNEGGVTVMVKDFGKGISPDKQELIFSRFFRVMDRSDFTSGLGIGLYICREIISRHQGEIWVESREGEGAAFYFKFCVTPHTGC